MKYKPHNYQAFASEFILEHPVCCLMLDMGLGKTVITLTALWELVLDRFDVSRILVIAPKRVAEDTWPKETPSGSICLGCPSPWFLVPEQTVKRLFARGHLSTSSTERMWRGWWRITAGTSTWW